MFSKLTTPSQEGIRDAPVFETSVSQKNVFASPLMLRLTPTVQFEHFLEVNGLSCVVFHSFE